MNPRPGPRLLGWVALLLAPSLAALAWPGAAWLALALILPLPALLAWEWWSLRRALAGVDVRRTLPACVGRGRAFQATLAVRSAGGGGLLAEVRDARPAAAEPAVFWKRLRLAADGEAECSEELRIAVRGRHAFGPVWLRLRGRLGLLEGQRRLECPGEVKVFPESLVSRDEDLLKQASDVQVLMDKLARTRRHGEGMDFESLIEYRPGDDPQRIDWRASARRGQLIRRRFQVERHRDVMLLLDCGRMMGGDAGGATKLDRAVDAALMLGRVALEHGDRCGAGFFDDRLRGYLPPLSGPSAYRTLSEHLYDVQSEWREANFDVMFAALQARQTRRALIVILSDLTDEETSSRYLLALATLARRHVVLFAALQTPLLTGMLTGELAGTRDLARKAVVIRVLREREAALHTLRRSGVNILDVRPDQLTVPLINQYLRLREGNIL